MNSTSIINDNCCLLETIHEKEVFNQEKNKTYSTWALSTSNRSESRNTDTSTFHSFNPLSIPSSSSSSHLSNELCSPKSHSTIPTSPDYSVAIVSASTNNSSNTPVSSDDGFCGSSDISDPSVPGGHHHHHSLSSSYRQPYIIMKDNILNKSSTNGTDTTRRVRFNLTDQTLRQVEQIYMTRKNLFEKPSFNSTIV